MKTYILRFHCRVCCHLWLCTSENATHSIFVLKTDGAGESLAQFLHCILVRDARGADVLVVVLDEDGELVGGAEIGALRATTRGLAVGS